jgi:hypothetical protein
MKNEKHKEEIGKNHKDLFLRVEKNISQKFLWKKILGTRFLLVDDSRGSLKFVVLYLSSVAEQGSIF